MFGVLVSLRLPKALFWRATNDYIKMYLLFPKHFGLCSRGSAIMRSLSSFNFDMNTISLFGATGTYVMVTTDASPSVEYNEHIQEFIGCLDFTLIWVQTKTCKNSRSPFTFGCSWSSVEDIIYRYGAQCALCQYKDHFIRKHGMNL